jgi:hypothetical protein
MYERGLRGETRPLLARSRQTLALALTLLGLGFPRVATSQERMAPPLLLGGETTVLPRPIPLDPRLPRGELRTEAAAQERARSPERALLLHSSHYPLSVSAPDRARAQRALALLEEAFARFWLAEGAAPRRAPLHWHLSEDQTDILPEVQTLRLPSFGFDRARAICEGGAPYQAAAETCVAEGLLLGVAPATARSIARGYSHYRRATDPRVSAHEPPHEALKSAPYLALVTREPRSFSSRSSSLFFAALAARAGASARDTSFIALGLTATRTAPGALRWDAEPDVLDVLRRSLGTDRESYARFFDRLAIARFVPTEGLDVVRELQGDLAAPAWSIEVSSLPRNLSLKDPLAPTGSVAIELKSSSPIDSPLALRLDCESPVTYVWSVLRLAPNGELQSQFPIPYRETSSRYEERFEPQGAHRLFLVGTNLGGVDLDHPYDPDHSPHEAHGCSVYLTRAP